MGAVHCRYLHGTTVGSDAMFPFCMCCDPCHLLAHLRLHPAAWYPERWANEATLHVRRMEHARHYVPPEERAAREAATAVRAADLEAAIAAAGALGPDGLSRERGAVPCDRCGRRFMNHSDLYKHQGAAEDKPYCCDGEAVRPRNPWKKPKSAAKTGSPRRRNNSGGSSSTDASAATTTPAAQI